MSVRSPPSDAPTERRIRRSDGLTRAFHPSATATGSITATVPVELVNAESPPAPSMSVAVRPARLEPAAAPIALPMRSATPVRNWPPPTTNSAAIITTTGSAKPASALAGVRIPVSASASSDSSATKSSRSRSLTNSAIVAARIAKTSRASPVMLHPPV